MCFEFVSLEMQVCQKLDNKYTPNKKANLDKLNQLESDSELKSNAIQWTYGLAHANVRLFTLCKALDKCEQQSELKHGNAASEMEHLAHDSSTLGASGTFLQ